jgi:hypothetical protein
MAAGLEKMAITKWRLSSFGWEGTKMNPLDPNILLASVVATAVLFAAIAFFARAGIRRIVGVLVAAIPIIPLIMLYDGIAGRLGWWRYPSVTSGSAPLAWYIAAALFYGAGLGLIGWRVIRRFGWPGLTVFLAGFALFGVARDYFYSMTAQLIVFGSGLLPYFGDGFSYASAAVLVQILMYWIAGPPASDRLARERSLTRPSPS